MRFWILIILAIVLIGIEVNMIFKQKCVKRKSLLFILAYIVYVVFNSFEMNNKSNVITNISLVLMMICIYFMFTKRKIWNEKIYILKK